MENTDRYNPYRQNELGLPDLANETTGHTVNSNFRYTE